MVKEEESNLNGGAVWNFDDAESQLLFHWKSMFNADLDSWKLEDAYRHLRLLKMEVKAIFKPDENEAIEFEFKELTEIRRQNNDNADNLSDEDKGLYYQNLEKCYEDICALIKKHGLYFREKEVYYGL